ncbi:glycosyltransferase family A protein [Bacillus sp. DX4.1]|uniref:glycosyltransferase n=1 Tax=Bacillus sp. DX4.1 TaxID=3055867 RepID=UPI0025A08BA5|nr:glycosyltransferase family A protein [Bacillus sp. DX4.1]MDM5187520.1 glycosyltransferase family A protein [Bacillus sp. DX4.1]
MVSIITCTKREDYIDNVFENCQRQEWKEKELIIILNNDSMSIEKWKEKARFFPNTSIYQLSESISLGYCLNFGIEKSQHGHIAKFDDDDYYAPKYLTQAMDALKEKGASVVGKITTYLYFEDKGLLAVHMPNYENEYLPKNINLKGATIVFKKDVFSKVQFADKNCDEDDIFTRDCRKHRIKVYVTDRSNFVYIRREDPGHHTWKQKYDEILKYCSDVRSTNDYKVIASHVLNKE